MACTCPRSKVGTLDDRVALGHEVGVASVGSLLTELTERRIELDRLEGVQRGGADNLATLENTTIPSEDLSQVRLLLNAGNVGLEGVLEAAVNGIVEDLPAKVGGSILHFVVDPDLVHEIHLVTVDGMTADHIPVARVLHVWLATGQVDDHCGQNTLLFLVEQVFDLLESVVARVGVDFLDSLAVDPSVARLLVRKRADILSLDTINVDKQFPNLADDLACFLM